MTQRIAVTNAGGEKSRQSVKIASALQTEPSAMLSPRSRFTRSGWTNSTGRKASATKATTAAKATRGPPGAGGTLGANAAGGRGEAPKARKRPRKRGEQAREKRTRGAAPGDPLTAAAARPPRSVAPIEAADLGAAAGEVPVAAEAAH